MLCCILQEILAKMHERDFMLCYCFGSKSGNIFPLFLDKI